MILPGPVAVRRGSVDDADPFPERTLPDLRLEQVEIEQPVERDRRMGCGFLDRIRIEPVHRLDRRAKFRFPDQVPLVEDQLVGDRYLFPGFVVGFELAADMLQIDQGDDGVQPVGQVELHIGIQQLGERRRVGDARRLDQDPVELDLRFEGADPAHERRVEGFDEVVLAGAADAAVGQLEHVVRRAGDQVRIDADLAELVDDDQAFAAAGIGEDVVDQRRLARAQEAGHEGDRHPRIVARCGWSDRHSVSAFHAPPPRRPKPAQGRARSLPQSSTAQARTGEPLPLLILSGGP